MTAFDLTALDAVAPGSPLSIGQARLWAQDLVTPWQIHTVLRLTGDLDRPALAAALSTLVDRHELLRSDYQQHAGRPVRVVRDALPVPMEFRDLSAVLEAQRAETLRALLDQDAAVPVPFDAGPALRATLFRLAVAEHVLLLTVHRMACDDWSAGLLVDELAEIYDAVSKGGTPALSAPAASYADFVAWQRDLTETADGPRRYWQAKLAGLRPVSFPTDRERPAGSPHATEQVRFPFPRELRAELRRVGEQRRVTPFIVLLAAYQVMLGRYARQEDVAVGTPAAGRTRREFEGLVGPLSNTLVLRTDLSGDPTLDEVLDRVRAVALGAYDHQHVPVGEPGTGDPLVRTMVTYLARTPPRSRLGALAVDALDAPSPPSAFDLVLTVDDQGPEPVATIQYATGLFDRSTVESIAGDYLAVVRQVLEAPDRRLSAVTLTGQRVAAARIVVAGSPRSPHADHVDVAAIEETILRAWRELLGRDDIGPEDNFFDAGGHSHLLIEVQHRLSGQVPAQLRIVSFFRHPTVRALAAHVAHVAAQEQAPAARVEQVPQEQERHSAGRRESLRKQRARHRAKSGDTQGEQRNAGRV